MLLRYFVSTLFGNLTRCLQRTESNRTKMASKYTPDNRLKADLRKNADNLLTKSDKEKSQTTNYQLFAILKARSEADSNRCTRFCRPLPSHSAIRPNRRSFPYPNTSANPHCSGLRTKKIGFEIANIQTFLIFAKLIRNFPFSPKITYLYTTKITL